MFELDGEQVDLEFLENQAQLYDMDFDSYLEAMKEKGLVEKTNGSAEATPTGEPTAMESESGDGSSVLLERIEAGDYDYEIGEAPVEEEEETTIPKDVKPKLENFFTEIIPTETDVTNIPMVSTNIDKLTVEEDYERVDDFISDKNLQKLNDNYRENGVTFNRFRKNIVVKLPGMESSRSFPIPSGDQGLARLKNDMASYIVSNPSDKGINQETSMSIDAIWNNHSKKWNAEDLMVDDLGELLGSDYKVYTAGTFGNEFIVERVDDGGKMPFKVGGAEKAGWANTSDELKKFILTKTYKYEDDPKYKKERKDITQEVINNYLENPTNLNEILNKADITNFSDIATPKNKEVLIDHIMSDLNAKGDSWFRAARRNFDNLSNVDIDEIVHGVISADVAADWAELARRDGDKEINEQITKLIDEGYSHSEAEVAVFGAFVKQHSANFTNLEAAISEINLLIDNERSKENPDDDKIDQLNIDLKPVVDKYKTRANYDVLFDSNTGKLAPNITDPKSPGIIDLTEDVSESMGNYEAFSREDLKEEFIKTSASLKEWEDKTRTSKFRPKRTISHYNKAGQPVYKYSKSDEWDVLIEQKVELLKKLEGLKRTYLLNERLDTVDKSDWSGLRQQAGRAFYTSLGVDENTAIINNGVTEAQTVAAIKDLYIENNVPLSRAAEVHSKVNTWDMVSGGVGGTPRIVAEFAGFGKLVHGAKYLLGVNKWVQGLAKSRFLKGSTYLSGKAITKQANRWAVRNNIGVTAANQQKIIGAYAAESGIKVVAPSLFNRGIITSVGALSEGLVFMGVERDIEGMPKGIGFSLAGKVIPPALKSRMTFFNTLYKVGSGGVRMASGNQVGTAFNGLVKDAMGHEDWQVFLKNNYDDPDQVMGGIITDLVLGAGLSMTHMNRFDVQSHSRIKRGMGEFDTKRRQYIDERGDIKKGEETNFEKWNDLYNTAKKRVYENEGIQDYLDPLKAAAIAKREVEKSEADYKEMGYNGVDIKFKKPDKKERKGEFKINKKTNKVEIEIDPENITPGLISHELHHPLYMTLMKDLPAKAANIKKLLDITKKIKLREDFSLYDAIKQKGVEVAAIEGMDLAKVREAELFAYISETLRNGAHYDGVKNSNGWWQLKKWIQGDTKAIVNNRSMNDIVNWFGKYNENIGEGGSNLPHFEKLAELIENMEVGVEPTIAEPGVRAPLIEGLGMGASIKLQTYKDQVGLGSERLVDTQGRDIKIDITKEEEKDFNTELQKTTVKPISAKDAKKIEQLKKVDTSKLSDEMKAKLENDIINLEAGADVYKVVEMYDPSLGKKTAGTGRVINKMASRSKTPGWDIIKDDVLREFLTSNRGIKGLTADYNRKVREGDINPETFPLGKFIGGKFDVRFQGIVERLQAKKFAKPIEAETTAELVAPKDPILERLETEDISPRAQIERKRFLEERGLTEETAESYIAEQNLITLSKELRLKNAENVVNKAKTTIPELKRNLEPQRPGESKKEYNQRIVSHKNSIKQYRESIEKDLWVNFWGISKTTADKMSTVGKEGQALKTAMAWQIKGTEKKPGDLQTVKKVVEAKNEDGSYRNAPTILTAISKGAQSKIDPIDLTEVAPDIVKGKSAGAPKVLLHNELLFTPTSKRQQTAAGLQPFIQSEGFIKYQKTTDQIYKTEFERKFVESLKTPQHYKAVMQEVGKNVYLQSVRSALPAESMLARQLEAGKNEGLASERLLNDQIIKDKGKFKASLSGVDRLFKTPEYEKFSEKDKNDFLNKYAEKLDAAKGKSEVELMVEGGEKPKVEMEAIETKNHKEMTTTLVKKYGSKREFYENVNTGETMDGWSKIPSEKAKMDIFEAAVINYYPKGSKSIVTQNASNGKNYNWNFKTKKYELISYPKGKEKTLQNWMNHNLGSEVWTGNGKKITDAEYWFLRESVTKDTGDFKTKVANEMVAAANRGATKREMIEINHKLGREEIPGKTKDFNRVLEANKAKRQFHMDAIKHVVENHADYGLTRQEAIQCMWRHVRRHTNITAGSLKGTATITAGTIEIGIPVSKDPFAKNFLGSMYHAEHQMQLQNHTYTWFNSLGRNWNKKNKNFNEKRYKDEMEILSELFEQSTTVKQDQLIYDSGLFGGNTTYLKAFAGKNLGEVSSILNILYQKGVSGSIVDYKSKIPKTIEESIIDNYNQRQLDILLKESTKLGEPNTLHYELSSANKNRNAIEKNNLKIVKNSGLPIVKNAKPSEVLASIRIGDTAIRLGRKKNKKTKGGSFWDLDDTLLRTKSGVRYTLPNPSGKPAPRRKVIFMAGGPGSGKSTVIKGLKLQEQGFKIVNQDISLEWLMKNHGLPKDMKDFTPEQASKFGELTWDARMIAKRKQTKFQGKGDGVIIDGTGNSLKTMQNHVQEFRNKGYDVQMMFVETSLETALQRNKTRKERSLKESIVKRTHESVQKNKEAFKEMFGENFAEVKTDKLKQGDPMPVDVVGKVNKFTKGYIKGRLDAGEYAHKGADLEIQGAKFDFVEFDYIKEGTEGPLWNEAMNKAKKFGTKDTYILTARPHAAQIPIFRFLEARGLKIPFENVITLENSTPEAKALKIAEKIGEGYNDIYFADDALQNVQAVKNIMEQFDVKGKVQQALASERLDIDVNNIMEHSLGIESKKRFSKAEGKVRGKDKKRRKFFIPDSAADLELLIEPLYGKGKKGTENKKWFEKEFLKPWERGINDLNTARQTILNDYQSLRKNNKDVVKSMDKPAGETNFTNDMAMRVYLFNKAGFKIPGLSKTAQKNLVEYVQNNPKLQAYAESVAKLTKIETGLKKPTETWWAETLASEVSETGRRAGREKYIGDWIEKKNEIFSEENLNKMEAELGPKWRESMENILWRMETGRMRNREMGRIGNAVMDYLNGSVGTIMNLNTRSATLQLISTINFINHAENNPLAATKAFANQPQYWKDFMTIMNSDMLKQRRDGLQINVTEAEIAAAASGKGNKAKRVLAWILKQGYIPTKIADSFAIASGGATYYRNRIKMYEKQGLKTKEAEKKAWIDFQAIAERTQQSSRPDLLSMQQVSFEGRLLLPFANTPMQMNRIAMKEQLDIAKGRYDGWFGENSFTNKMSKIAYYYGIQSAIFAGLQTGLFALMANHDDEELIAKKKIHAVNGMSDSFLRGMGIPGVVMSGMKNASLKFLEQNEKGFTADYSEVGEALLNMSPTIGSKFSKMDAAGSTYAYNKKEILEKGFSLDNTKAIEAAAQTIEAITNYPVHRPIRKTDNIEGFLDERNENWQRIMNLLGWSKWDVGASDYQKKDKDKDKKKKKKSPEQILEDRLKRFEKKMLTQ